MSQSDPDPEDRTIAESQPDGLQADSDLERGQSVRVVSTATSWRGPLPPPVALRQYEDILPGGAERIFQRWETQSDHRMRMESVAVLGGSRRAYMGLIFAFLLSLAIISAGTYIAISINPWAGTTAIGTGVAGLAGVFVYGTNSRRRERERKAADSEPRRE